MQGSAGQWQVEEKQHIVRRFKMHKPESGMIAMSRKTILRLMLLAVVVIVGSQFGIGWSSLRPVPGDEWSKAFAAAADASGYDFSRVAWGVLPYSLAILVGVVGFAGLWWCRRWARIAFSAAVILTPATSFALYLIVVAPAQSVIQSHPASQPVTSPWDPFLITNDILALVTGAIVALIWFGMPEEFAPAPARNQPVRLPA